MQIKANLTPVARAVRAQQAQQDEAKAEGHQGPEESFSWRDAALVGMAGLGLLGTAQVAQAQTVAQPQADLGSVKGLLLPKGRVDSDGTIRNVLGWPVGKVKADGRITEMIPLPIGSVDSKGYVYKYGSWISEGRVDPDGTIRDNWGIKIGSVKGQDDSKLEMQERGGAALLLLMQKE
jgi:hypothetical protein